MVGSLPAIRGDGPLELADLKLLMAEQPWPSLLDLLRIARVATRADPEPYERLRRRAAAIAPDEVQGVRQVWKRVRSALRHGRREAGESDTSSHPKARI